MYDNTFGENLVLIDAFFQEISCLPRSTVPNLQCSTLILTNDLEDKGQGRSFSIGFLSSLRCIFGENLGEN